MMATILIESDGSVRAIKGGDTAWLAAEGECEVRRASHVLPTGWLRRQLFRLLRRAFGDEGRAAAWTRRWGCRWRADLGPSGGPCLRGYSDRGEAIEAELAWLRTYRGL
jgi:hypothetical protein